MLSILLALTPISLAVPAQLIQNGRLLDSSGAAVTGTHALTFRLYDVDIGGQPLWEDFIVTDFNSGYYSAVLGANGLNPLDDSVLQLPSVYLEVQMDADPPLSPRQSIQSAPYARIAAKAESIEGGTVDATSLSVNGSLVVDGSGSWVGPTINVNWSAIQNMPADIADGDDDTLAGINCSTGEILGWNGSQWACAADNGLTEAEVEAYVTNGPIDLDGATTLGGLPILTDGANGTLSSLSCQDGELAKYDQVLGSWACGLDNNTSDWNALANVPADIADGDDDTQLSENEVEDYVVNGALDWAPGTTLGGQTLMTSPSCNHGEFISYDSAQGIWICQEVMDMFDSDGDGVATWDDCDDSDPLILGEHLDADCDGVPTGDDCDDNDPNSTTVSTDGDCDGALTADDCNDADANVGNQAFDADCDGATTIEDCDDSDANAGSSVNDADCDGTITANDCDDFDSNSYNVFIDGDCDGTLTSEDCDDNNPLSTSIADDADCDGTVTALDCDDTDANSNTLNNDFDCDGAISAIDCDDANDQVGPNQIEVCGDGIDNDCNGVDDYCIDPITFTNCGVGGRTGPSQNDCILEYAGTDLNGAVTLNDGIQQWVVPTTGIYRIEAWGAASRAQTYSGLSDYGYGARMRGDFALNAGDVLHILVGQRPNQSSFNGGGGGTFVAIGSSYSNASPLIVAGGGGSIRSGYNAQGFESYAHGVTTEDGVDVDNLGGSNGDGAAPGIHGGSGGAGFYGDATYSGYTSYAFVNGGEAGIYSCCADSQAGGFGGGGVGGWGGSGGGGGYSGGGAGNNNHGIAAVGGGGGSYNAGNNQDNTAGENNDHGKVVISTAN